MTTYILQLTGIPCTTNMLAYQVNLLLLNVIGVLHIDVHKKIKHAIFTALRRNTILNRGRE